MFIISNIIGKPLKSYMPGHYVLDTGKFLQRNLKNFVIIELASLLISSMVSCYVYCAVISNIYCQNPILCLVPKQNYKDSEELLFNSAA